MYNFELKSVGFLRGNGEDFSIILNGKLGDKKECLDQLRDVLSGNYDYLEELSVTNQDKFFIHPKTHEIFIIHAQEAQNPQTKTMSLCALSQVPKEHDLYGKLLRIGRLEDIKKFIRK
jgi:hypothetical protein